MFARTVLQQPDRASDLARARSTNGLQSTETCTTLDRCRACGRCRACLGRQASGGRHGPAPAAKSMFRTKPAVSPRTSKSGRTTRKSTSARPACASWCSRAAAVGRSRRATASTRGPPNTPTLAPPVQQKSTARPTPCSTTLAKHSWPKRRRNARPKPRRKRSAATPPTSCASTPRDASTRIAPKGTDKNDEKAVCAKCEMRMACYDSSDARKVRSVVDDCQKKHATAIKVVEP